MTVGLPDEGYLDRLHDFVRQNAFSRPERQAGDPIATDRWASLQDYFTPDSRVRFGRDRQAIENASVLYDSYKTTSTPKAARAPVVLPAATPAAPTHQLDVGSRQGKKKYKPRILSPASRRRRAATAGLDSSAVGQPVSAAAC
eukprot:g19000.t1